MPILEDSVKSNKLGNQLDLTVFCFWVLTTCFFGNSEASPEAAPLPQLPPEPPRHGFENFLVLTELVVNVFGVPEFVFFVGGCFLLRTFRKNTKPFIYIALEKTFQRCCLKDFCLGCIVILKLYL